MVIYYFLANYLIHSYCKVTPKTLIFVYKSRNKVLYLKPNQNSNKTLHKVKLKNADNIVKKIKTRNNNLLYFC